MKTVMSSQKGKSNKDMKTIVIDRSRGAGAPPRR
jgi:hypothetical protein